MHRVKGISLQERGVIVALLVALLVVSLEPVWAGGTPRTYRMSLFFQNTVNADTDFGWIRPGFGQTQQSGYSILELLDLYFDYINGVSSNLPTPSTLNSMGYDWSRIVAVIIDEPYLNALKDNYVKGRSTSPSPCVLSSYGQRNPDGASQMQANLQKIAKVEQFLRSAAEAVKAVSPKTRFWVNFSNHEMDWMSTCHLNQPYIDVVSLDIYRNNFSNIRPYYDGLVANPASPYQQLALVPGVFQRDAGEYSISDADAAALLPGFFDYADEMNRNCRKSSINNSMNTEPTSVNGCYVWMISGWPNFDFAYPEGGSTYYGFYYPTSEQIRAAWRKHMFKPGWGWLWMLLEG